MATDFLSIWHGSWGTSCPAPRPPGSPPQARPPQGMPLLQPCPPCVGGTCHNQVRGLLFATCGCEEQPQDRTNMSLDEMAATLALCHVNQSLTKPGTTRNGSDHLGMYSLAPGLPGHWVRSIISPFSQQPAAGATRYDSSHTSTCKAECRTQGTGTPRGDGLHVVVIDRIALPVPSTEFSYSLKTCK